MANHSAEKKPTLKARPEPKSPTELLDLQQKAARIASGQEAPSRSTYPYILPDYRLPFYHVGTETQLFFDNLLIEWFYDVERVMVHPEKHPEPVLRCDLPWESDGNPLPWVLYDEEAHFFRMWYKVSAGRDPNLRHFFCYAESADGLVWKKPTDRGGMPFDEHPTTNIVVEGVWFSVLKEPQEPDSGKRYKILGWTPGAAFSADGYRAQRVEPTPYRNLRSTCVLWDAALRKYVAYGQYGHHVNRIRRRGVGRQESEDFLNWGPKEEVIAPDDEESPAVEYSDACVHKVGSLYIATVMRYDMEPIWHANGKSPMRYQVRTFSHPDCQLAYSRDGRRWSFAGKGSVWVENGPPGSLDYGYVHNISAPALFNGRLYFYYMASRYKQGLHPEFFDDLVPKALRRRELYGAVDFQADLSPTEWRDSRVVALFTLRQDGYVRIQPRYEEGALLTRQFVFEGDRLYLNLKADYRYGYAQVEILDDEMEPIEGFRREDCRPVRGDSICHEVQWQGGPDVSGLWNRPVRLKIYLRECWLYSYRFGYARQTG